ncbi:hypothetical protein BKA80DRAFT_9913 [Phyllosticta citrichinensis]
MAPLRSQLRHQPTISHDAYHATAATAAKQPPLPGDGGRQCRRERRSPGHLRQSPPVCHARGLEGEPQPPFVPCPRPQAAGASQESHGLGQAAGQQLQRRLRQAPVPRRQGGPQEAAVRVGGRPEGVFREGHAVEGGVAFCDGEEAAEAEARQAIGPKVLQNLVGDDAGGHLECRHRGMLACRGLTKITDP